MGFPTPQGPHSDPALIHPTGQHHTGRVAPADQPCPTLLLPDPGSTPGGGTCVPCCEHRCPVDQRPHSPASEPPAAVHTPRGPSALTCPQL